MSSRSEIGERPNVSDNPLLSYQEKYARLKNKASSDRELTHWVHPDGYGSTELWKIHNERRESSNSRTTDEKRDGPRKNWVGDSWETIRNSLSGTWSGFTGKIRSVLTRGETKDNPKPNEAEPSPLPAGQNFDEDYDISDLKMARSVLELEWKIENAESYLSEDSFAQGSGASEGEYILSALDEERRRDLIVDMVEEGELYSDQYGDLSKAWFQNDTLMAYDWEIGQNTKLDFYNDIRESICSLENSSRLKKMLDEQKNQFEDYESAAIKSIYSEEVEGQIGESELQAYIKNYELN